jgi:arylsulfatase A-like enzyme
MSVGTSNGSNRGGNDFDRRTLLLGSVSMASALVAASTLSPGLAATANRPNIVYIVADDIGWKDVGFHGSDIRTPNLDRLVATGAELEQFYAQPMCTPTRAALMTGRYPLRYGLQTGVIPSGSIYGLQTDEWLLPQALKEAGYTTALVGKWHLGHGKREFWPRQRGFDSFYGALVGEIDHFKHTAHGRLDWYRDNKVVDEPGYDTTLFGNEAVRLIEKQDAGKPLFLYLAFTAPHTPYQAPQSYLDRYKDIADPSRQAYAAQITAMDDEIGRVVATLDRRGMRDNTIIVFHSDNGGTRSKLFAGEGAVKGELPPSNGPYREGKGTLYEGGTRVVALVNWPGKIKPGKTDGMIHVADMYPTLIGLAQGSTAKAKPLDGVDVWKTLSDNAPSSRSEIVYNVEPLQAAVRQGDWKLYWHAALPPCLELFDLAADASEAKNLADQNPDRVKALQNRIVTLAGQMAPPMFFAAAIGAAISAPLATPTEDVYWLDETED